MDIRAKKNTRVFKCLFPLSLLYYEIIFRLFTIGGVFRVRSLLMIPFCCAYGFVGYFLATLSRNRRVNRLITAVLLFLTAIPYGVEAFVYREFRIFFNIQAILGGAGDVASEFSGEAFRMVLSLQGIACIALFLLPGVLYLLLGRAPVRIGGRERGMAAARAAAYYLICVMVIQMTPVLSRLYGDEYSFNAAVDQFGFLTGVQLDVRDRLFGRNTFQDVDIVEALATPTPAVTPEITPEPVVYEPNQLNLPLDDPFGNATDDIKQLNAYVANQKPSMKNEFTGRFAGKNLIIITAEAFCREVIDPELTPTLYRMATKGINFTDYYQFAGAGTIGGEYQHLFGLLPMEGVDSFQMMTENVRNMSIAHALADQGYQGAAYHNGECFFYDRDQTHIHLGYTDGFLALGNGLEDVLGVEWTDSDKLMFEKTVPTYIDRQPFCCYYMTISAHAPYGFDDNDCAARYRERVEGLSCSDQVKGYLASNQELEEAMAYLIGVLEEKGIADDTVICLTGDHFPYGLDDGAGLGNMPYLSELYGYEVENSFQRDHNAWLLWCGELEDEEPVVIDGPTSSLDILPTLYNLFGIDFDSRLFPGRDVFSDAPAFIFTTGYDWKSDLGEYFNEEDTFTPVSEDVVLPDGYVENMKAVASNKISFCSGVLETDYYGYLFGSN